VATSSHMLAQLGPLSWAERVSIGRRVASSSPGKTEKPIGHGGGVGHCHGGLWKCEQKKREERGGRLKGMKKTKRGGNYVCTSTRFFEGRAIIKGSGGRNPMSRGKKGGGLDPPLVNTTMEGP